VGVFRLHARLLPGDHIELEFLVAVRPVADFFDQPFLHCPTGLLHPLLSLRHHSLRTYAHWRFEVN
jgi:hypothetical protein